jgi:hypothetical protein
MATKTQPLQKTFVSNRIHLGEEILMEETTEVPNEKNDSIKLLEEKLTELMAENWRDSKIANAIAKGVKDKINDMMHKMSRGIIKNTAGNRGYLEALMDLHTTLTQTIEEATEETEQQKQEVID